MTIAEQYLEMFNKLGLDKEFIQSEYKAMKEQEKENLKKLEKPLKIKWDGRDIEIKLKSKVTGELKSKLRKLAKKYPKTLKETVKLYLKRDIDWENSEQLSKLMQEIADNSIYTYEEIDEYNKTSMEPISEKYDYLVTKFYLEYLKLIMRVDSLNEKDIELIQSAIENEDGITEFWNTAFDILEVQELVTFFRNKTNL